MKKVSYLLLFIGVLSLFTINAHSQVTIGSNNPPNPNAVLDLQSQSLGFLPPRLALEKLWKPVQSKAFAEGLVVYNTKHSPGDSLEVGLYYCKLENGKYTWERLINQSDAKQSPFSPLWFYAPSFTLGVLPKVNGTDSTYTVNLHDKYKQQLSTGGDIVRSHSLDIPVSYVEYTPMQLHYYIVGYDKSVFQNLTLNQMGVLNYTITPASAGNVSDTTYMNIVFSVKK